ncbi:hypothetical protein CERSUDRAFT_111045 [Gelatoporia subvermispora B]|uniref:Thioesterase domain-containing protein n=1 Tax=Ceriporiopsis subvermispora (strain B) TaxID=914234 RepID=M2R7Q0_CERS8|nr:hypothetical protein CERSUDRAFT_111045 [Gelatoporia subvermispora B]
MATPSNPQVRFFRVIIGLLRSALKFSHLKPLAYVLGALLLVNIRSFPLVWHARVLGHLVVWNLRRLLASDKRRFLEATAPIADDPWKRVSVHKGWASPDDCDFLGHLSNSCYAKVRMELVLYADHSLRLAMAKNLDHARIKICVSNVAPFMLEGGWMPLGGADYLFVSEIPIFSHYEIRSKVASWDDKWLYVHSEFVTRPERTSKATKTVEAVADCAAEKTLDRPKHNPRKVREDGTVLHCVAISRYCFKMGRITVPPRIVLSICGFGSDRSNWVRSETMKSQGQLRQFLEGGWRSEKGWDLPEFEERRLAGLEWCRKISEGISAAEWDMSLSA